MPTELTKISSYQLDSLTREKTVFFFPVGPIEDHGPHLPLGLDVLEAEQLCHIAAQHLEETMNGWVGVVMPPAPLGIDSNTSRLAITVRSYVLRDWLVDSCKALNQAGFIHFVCFTGHLGPRQLTAIEDAGKLIRKMGFWKRVGAFGRKVSAPSLVSASSALVDWKEVWKSPFLPDPLEHGGQRDTSVAIACSKKMVHEHYKTLPSVEREKSKWVRSWHRRRKLIMGYWGEPSRAQLKQGKILLSGTVQEIFPKMRAVWEGANPNSLFRSWYSILPPNKSFFKSWMLVISIILLFSGWLFMLASSLDLK